MNEQCNIFEEQVSYKNSPISEEVKTYECCFEIRILSSHLCELCVRIPHVTQCITYGENLKDAIMNCYVHIQQSIQHG